MPTCIFCKSSSTPFLSVEHIIPESLGNTEHVLPPGIVCDRCNNYFAGSVEGPILRDKYFCQVRHRNGIPSKRKRVPSIGTLAFPHGIALDLGVDRDGERLIAPNSECDNDRFVNMLSHGDGFSVVFPVAARPKGRLFARFLITIALRAFAKIALKVPMGLEADHINNAQLDEARNFARYGAGPRDWPYHETVLYEDSHVFIDDENGRPFHISHEFKFLLTTAQELYFAIALFGVQYTINLGGPELEGFEQWLAENDNRSPLYLPT